MNLDDHFEFLDELPEAIFQPVVTLHHGSLRQRVEGILAWRHALLRGELPDVEAIGWPERSIAETIRRRIDGLDLVTFCRNEEALVDQVLKDVCAAITALLRREAEGVHELFEDTVPAHRRREREDSHAPADAAGGPSGAPQSAPSPAPAGRGVTTGEAPPRSGDEGVPAAPQGAGQGVAGPAVGGSPDGVGTTASFSEQALAGLGEDLARHWKRVLAHWREVAAEFRGMGSRLGRGWDLSSGELRGRGWREFVAYRRVIREHPQLVAVVNGLGREQAGGEDAGDESRHPAEDGDEGSLPRPVFVHAESPLSTAGVSRSDDIARMLPQEAAFLGHPKLKMLWHARRAEQGLLGYQVEGVLSEHRPESLQAQAERPEARRHDGREKGPLIVCLDTSASMHGEPARIGKAVCLEVLRLANQTGRRCYLYAFSGPGQVLEQELRFDPPGLRRLLRFLAQGFEGGTDIREPVLRALARVRRSAWRKADILLISDGRFPVPEAVVRAVDRARERDALRIVGLLVGRWADDGLRRLCRPVHRFEPPSTLAARTGAS